MCDHVPSSKRHDLVLIVLVRLNASFLPFFFPFFSLAFDAIIVNAQGRIYFYHAPTGVTQWHPPPPVQSHAPAPPMNPAPPAAHPYQTGATFGTPVTAGAATCGPPPVGYPNTPDVAPQAVQNPAVSVEQPTTHSTPAHATPAHAMPAHASAYVFDRPIELKLEEKFRSLSGDSFKITDVATDAVLFMMKGKVASVIKERKTLTDAQGQPLYSLTEAVFSLRDRMFITDAQTKQPVLCLRKKGFIPMMGTSTVQVWHGGSDEGSPYLEIKGNILRKAFNITECATGRSIGTVKRKSNAKSIILGKDSYILAVEPGIDSALLTTLTVALDEHYRDDGNKSGLSNILF